MSSTSPKQELVSCFSEHPLFIDSLIASGDRGLSCFLGWVSMVYSPKTQIPSGAADCCRVQLLIAAGAHFLRVGRSRVWGQPDRDKPRGWLDGQKGSSILFFYSKTKQITLKTWRACFIASQTLWRTLPLGILRSDSNPMWCITASVGHGTPYAGCKDENN